MIEVFDSTLGNLAPEMPTEMNDCEKCRLAAYPEHPLAVSYHGCLRSKASGLSPEIVGKYSNCCLGGDDR